MIENNDTSISYSSVPKNTTWRDKIYEATHVLEQSGIQSARHDCITLAAFVLGLSRSEFVLKLALENNDDNKISKKIEKNYDALIQKRARRVPLQHITGTAAFRYHDFEVGPGVFIPRPETELIVDLAVEHAKKLMEKGQRPKIVDLGTGSGAIAISLASELPEAEIYAIEYDKVALSWARKNIDRTFAKDEEQSHNSSTDCFNNHCRVKLYHDDLATCLPWLDEEFDIVISNPPYIPRTEVPDSEEVRFYDPDIALYSKGKRGLKMPYQVIKTAERLLKPGGFFVMEHFENQSCKIQQKLEKSSHIKWTNITTHQDLNFRDRATSSIRLNRTKNLDSILGKIDNNERYI